jgi:hypothetical protein
LKDLQHLAEALRSKKKSNNVRKKTRITVAPLNARCPKSFHAPDANVLVVKQTIHSMEKKNNGY